MTPERPERPDRFEVPESFVAPDPPSYEWSVQDYQRSVLKYLGWDESLKISPLVEVRTEYFTLQDGTPTDDRLTLLIVSDRLVASVLEWRTDSNFTQVCPGFHLSESDEPAVRSALSRPEDSDPGAFR